MKKILPAVLCCAFVCSCAAPGPKKISMVEAVGREEKIRHEADETFDRQRIVEKDGVKFRQYFVKTGDSLWSIAKTELGGGRYWEIIAQDNRVSKPYYIRPGRMLIINSDGYAASAKKTDRPFEYRTVKNKAFGVGEKLVFAIKYFGVTAGFATLEVRGIEKINGRDTYVLAATARTAPFFEVFHRVKDLITSNMDMLGMFSWKYSKNLEEGSYRNNSHMELNHKEGFARKKDGKECKIPAFAQDVLSQFYYYRAVFTGKEEKIYMHTTSDFCKTEEVVVEKIGEERIRVDAGEFDTYHIRPFLKFEGIFRQQGDVDIWLSKDENKIPVLLKSKIVIGTIDAVLQEAVVVKAE